MPNKKITAMPSLGGNQVPTDLVTAVDLSAAPVNQNVKSTLNDLFATITKNITDRAIRFQAPGSAPAVAAASQGALYHDGTAFLASSNGGAFEPLYTLSAQSAALVFAGPTSGGAATPTFRSLALTDLPQIATASLLGRVSAGTGTPEQITSTAALLTWLQTPTSANLSTAVTDATGAGGALVFAFGPTLTNPRFNTIVADPSGSGNNILFTPTVGAVNHLEILNAVSGSGPTIRPTGLSANQPLNLASRGTGIISCVGNQLRVTGNTAAAAGILELRGGNASLSGGQIRLYEVSTNGTNYVGFFAPDTVANNLLWELPATDGLAGQALSTNGAQILAWQSYNRGGIKNFIINGDMAICQRQAVWTLIDTSGYYTVDRWRSEVVVPSPTHYQQEWDIDAPDSQGFRRSLAMTCTNGILNATANQEVRVEQRIEGFNLAQTKFSYSTASELTVSFWVKSNVTGTFIVELIQPPGQGPVQVSASYSITTANTWERKTVTFPARTSGGAILYDNSYQLGLGFWLVAGSNYTSGASLQTTWGNTANRRAVGTQQIDQTGEYWKITGVQLEANSVATDFEYQSIQQSLANCQRYYFSNQSTSNRYFGTEFQILGGVVAAGVSVDFPVEMRAAPSFSVGAQNFAAVFCSVNRTFYTATNLILGISSTQNALIEATFSTVPIAVGQGLFLRPGLTNNLRFSAEL